MTKEIFNMFVHELQWRKENNFPPILQTIIKNKINIVCAEHLIDIAFFFIHFFSVLSNLFINKNYFVKLVLNRFF
jgi:hypothetical protein